MDDMNEDMAGLFLGGGSIKHTVVGGDVYFNADDLFRLFWTTGNAMGQIALQENDASTASMAYALIHLAAKTRELKSELLKREIEASYNADNN